MVSESTFRLANDKTLSSFVIGGGVFFSSFVRWSLWNNCLMILSILYIDNQPYEDFRESEIYR